MTLEAVLVWKELRHHRSEWTGMLLGVLILAAVLPVPLLEARPGRYATAVVLGSVVLAGVFVAGFLVLDGRHGAQRGFSQRLPIGPKSELLAKLAMFLIAVLGSILVSVAAAILGSVLIFGSFAGFLPNLSFPIYLVGLIAAGIMVFASGAVFDSKRSCLLSVLFLGLPLGVQQSFWFWQDDVPTALRLCFELLLPWGGLLLLTALGYLLLCSIAYLRAWQAKRMIAGLIGLGPVLGFAILALSVMGWEPHSEQLWGARSIDGHGHGGAALTSSAIVAPEEAEGRFRFSETRVTHDGRFLVGSAYSKRFHPWPIRVELATGRWSWAKDLPDRDLLSRMQYVFAGNKTWLSARAALAAEGGSPRWTSPDTLFFVQSNQVSDTDDVRGAFDLRDGAVLSADEAQLRARVELERVVAVSRAGTVGAGGQAGLLPREIECVDEAQLRSRFVRVVGERRDFTRVIDLGVHRLAGLHEGCLITTEAGTIWAWPFDGTKPKQLHMRDRCEGRTGR
jgi:hypothetical protein